jgi:hypothetical protein
MKMAVSIIRAVMMEAARSSETEDSHLCNNRRENLKSY